MPGTLADQQSRTAQPDYDVVINGGGPVGMGLAIELGQRGVRVCVVERYTTPQPVPKGQNLTQRTTEHFHFWGCEKEMQSALKVPEGGGIGGLTCYGTLLSNYHYNWLDRSKVRDFYFTRNLRLPQYTTEEILRRRAAEVAGVDILYGWQGVALEQDNAGVSLTIAERQGEGQRVLRGRYLVGCDGSHSFTRQAAGITQTQEDHNRLMALVVFTSVELDDLLKRYPGKAFYSVLNPKYDGYWLFFGRVDHGRSWFFHAPVPPGTTADNFDFPAFLHEAVGQPFDLTLDYVGFWDMRFAQADAYRKDRVFIAGDAAHSHPPYGGYGINSGLEDATNLGWKLAAALQGWGTEALLDSYHTERHGVFASTIRDFIARFIREDRDFLRKYAPDRDLADFTAHWDARSADTSEVTAFEPHYQGSSIVDGAPGSPSSLGGHERRARAGHHLAPQPLSGGRNVFEALGEDHALLALADADPAAITALEAQAAAAVVPLNVIRDTGAAAREAYGAPLILIRPDQFVAWAGKTPPVGLMDRVRGA